MLLCLITLRWDKIRESVEDRIKIGTTKKELDLVMPIKFQERWYKNG